MSRDNPRATRRAFLRVAVLGSASTVALAACSAPPPPSQAPPPATAPPTIPPKPIAAPPTTATAPTAAPPQPTLATTARPAASSVFPKWIPASGGPKPDFPGPGGLYQDGFRLYPAIAARGWTRSAPGQGSKVVAFIPTLRPAVPTPVDSNPAWQAVNKELNVDFQFIKPPAADYRTRLATIMAGSDLPDIMVFNGGLTATPSLPQFLQQAMTDLTPYLGGEAISAYPNLAAIPTAAWKNSGAVSNGRLMMVASPQQNGWGRLGSAFFTNSSAYEKAVGRSDVPTSADDFKRVLQALTSASAGQWGIGSYQGIAFNVAGFAQLFGAPNNWRLDAAGHLVKDRETPEYREAVGFARDLVASGVFHPDTRSITDLAAYGDAFVAGKFVLAYQGFGPTWQQQWLRGARLTPPFIPAPLGVFAAHAGGSATHFLNTGFFEAAGLKKASAERIKELLGVLDWLGAPFGSAEDLLLTHGVAEDDYTLDESGHPVPTARSNTDAAAIGWFTVMGHPPVAFGLGLPEFAEATVKAEQQFLPRGIEDPALGVYSQTDSTRGAVLNMTFLDNLTEVIVGARPLADLDVIVSEWQSGGGTQIRAELEQAIATA